jgi:hypothetical protein
MRSRTESFDVPAGFVRVPGLFRRAELEPIDKSYCDTCHRWGPRHSVHLCGANWHARLDHLLRELAADPVALAEGRAP